MTTIGLPNIRRTTFGTDYSDVLGASGSKKTESESTVDARTDYNKWSRNVMLLRIDAYRKYELLRMLNLLTVLSVRLLARVSTVLTILAIPVLELELVFERTLSCSHKRNLKLAFILVEHNVLVATANHIVPLLHSVAPDSKILSEMKAARAKMTAGINSVADAMRYELVSLMQSSYFSLVLDEATEL